MQRFATTRISTLINHETPQYSWSGKTAKGFPLISRTPCARIISSHAHTALDSDRPFPQFVATQVRREFYTWRADVFDLVYKLHAMDENRGRVGMVIEAYLYRSGADIERLLAS
jgi:hypothetical protein